MSRTESFPFEEIYCEIWNYLNEKKSEHQVNRQQLRDKGNYIRNKIEGARAKEVDAAKNSSSTPKTSASCLAYCMISAVFDYLDVYGADRDGKIRAFNILHQLSLISGADLQVPFAQNKVVLICKTLISFSDSTVLRQRFSMILEGSQRACNEEALNIFRIETLSFSHDKYQKMQSIFKLPFYDKDIQIPVIDYESIIPKLKSAADEYDKASVAGDKGERRLAHFRIAIEEIEKITDREEKERELVLLVCAVASSDCKHSSTKFAEIIIKKIGLGDKRDVYLLQLQDRISSYELNKKNAWLISSNFSLEHMTIENVKKAVDGYLNDEEIIKTNEDKNRVYNLNAALDSIDPANPDSKRDVVCLVYLAMKVGSKPFKDAICDAVQVPETEINLIPKNHEEQFGDFSGLTEKDAQVVLNEKNVVLFAAKIESVLSWFTGRNLDQLTMVILHATELYKKTKKPDELCSARMRNLLEELKKAVPQLDSSLNVRFSFERRAAEIFCAMILHSGSSDFKKELVKRFPRKYLGPGRGNEDVNVSDFEELQSGMNITHYEAWKTAKQLNYIAVQPDWKKFRDALYRAARFYRLYGESDMKGKIRAQRCLSFLEELDGGKLSPHETHYNYVLLAYTMICESDSTVLKENMADLLSVECKINVEDLKHLKEQFGISSKPTEKLEMELHCSSELLTDFNKLKARLSFAVKCAAPHADYFNRVLGNIINHVVAPDETKSKALLMLVEVTLHDLQASQELKDQILASLLQHSIEGFQIQYAEIFKKNEIVFQKAKALYEECCKASSRSEEPEVTRCLRDEAVPVASVAQDIAGDLRKALSRYEPGVAKIEGRQRRVNLETLLGNIEKPKALNHKILALIVCTIVLYSTSKSLRRKVLLFLNMSEEEVIRLQKKMNFEDDVCIECEKKLAKTTLLATDTLSQVDDNCYSNFVDSIVGCGSPHKDGWGAFKQVLLDCSHSENQSLNGLSIAQKDLVFLFRQEVGDQKDLNSVRVRKNLIFLATVIFMSGPHSALANEILPKLMLADGLKDLRGFASSFTEKAGVTRIECYAKLKDLSLKTVSMASIPSRARENPTEGEEMLPQMVVNRRP
jgi:hypothetical protein